MSTRSEAFVSDNQARDTVVETELALCEGGRFLALRVRALANMGAFLSEASAFIGSSNFARCLSSIYHFPRIAVGGADQIIVRQGDTRHRLSTVGTSTASRSTMTAGSAITGAIDVIIEKGRKVAARLLETAVGDIDYRSGAFGVIGTDRRVSLFVVAAMAAEGASRREPGYRGGRRNPANVPQWLPHRRGRDRSADGDCHRRRLHGHRRLWQGPGPDAGRRPAPRRSRPRPLEEAIYDRDTRPADDGIVHRLRDPASR
jgi:CO/xanthine dehydrogenase Mo-binding subunit